MNTIYWSSIAPPGGRFHVARGVYSSTSPFQEHKHDFLELFWVEQGPGVHWINGQRLRLDVGDLILVRQRDCHTFSVRGDNVLTLVNVAMPARHVEALRERYGHELEPWPWDGEGSLPTRWRLEMAQMQMLSAWAAGVSMINQPAMELDWFLTTLLRLGRPRAAGPVRSVRGPLPDWLADAIERFSSPAHLPNGVSGLAALAGRSPEHLNRVVRRCTGMTAGQLVNELRMEYAARELRMTCRPILDIAADVGLSNVGYFYASFRRHFGLPPRRYRMREQKMMA